MPSPSSEPSTLDSTHHSHQTPQPPQNTDEAPLAERGGQALSRRAFLGSGLGATAALTTGASVLPSLVGASNASAQSCDERKQAAFEIRVDAAYQNFIRPCVPHPLNGDQTNGIKSYSKGLPHNIYGEVLPQAYELLLQAVENPSFDAFEGLPPGEPDPNMRMRLVNPLSGIAFDMEGIDSHEFEMRAPPTFDSAEEAGEIVENYWMAILRDIPFRQYATDSLVQSAIADLNALSDFRGPKIGGQVTAQTLFREKLPDALVGPWISQYMWLSQPFGTQFIVPQMRTARPGQSFMTDPHTWRRIQNGTRPTVGLQYDSQLRYVRNGRDIGEWVHIDVLYQAYFQAALHLLTPPDPDNPFTGGGIGLPPNPGNPYIGSLKQEGFGTFGGPYFMTILTEVATRALKAVWFQKWFLHRRLRPEVFAGRVHHKLESNRPYPIHSDVLDSLALAYIVEEHGSYFLPMAFPEGSPMHPAYGAGHGTVAGACVTILKAVFDTQRPFIEFEDPVIPTDDGLALESYTGPDVDQMTVDGELNKLAYNVALGRNIAGVHWRSDGIESLKLGEEVAISVLRDQRNTYGEPFAGFTFRRFDGSTYTV